MLHSFVFFLHITRVASRSLRALQDEKDKDNTLQYTAFPTLSPTVRVLNVTVDDTTTSKEKAREYGFLLLWGALLLAVFVFATYIVNHFMDRFCCCCVFEPEAMDQGMVSRKAQLFGLTLSERAKLLARIFPSSLCWQAEETVSSAAATNTSSSFEVSEDPLTDTHHDRVCCICLIPYDAGVKVLKGTTCQHTFHYSCCMEWLQKHDECPYCRRELFTASELRAAAKEFLGEARVRAMGFPHLAHHADTTTINETIPTGMPVVPFPLQEVDESVPVLIDTTESSDVETRGVPGGDGEAGNEQTLMR